ncbi:MAG: TAXI family TRAP transporter solute-binding subunit [Oscillospiraceae bacterium]
MKKLISLTLAAVLALSLVACSTPPATEPSAGPDAPAVTDASGNPAPPASPSKYSMASGSVGGNFYLMGGGAAQVLNKYAPEYFNFTSETTGGGSANLSMLQDGSAELGVAMCSSLYEAMQGNADWTGGVKHDKLRGALALYPSWLTIYTMKGSGIKSMADLNGKIVGLGSKGAAMDAIFRKFFEENNIVPKQIHNDGHGATATAVGNGVIDAAILFSYPPFAAISELESTNDLAFIPLTADEQKYFTDKYDFHTASAMPAGSYKATTEDVPSISEWNMLVTSSDVPEDDVYMMIKTLCEHQDDMIAVHSSAKYMTAENTLNFNIPLHAGVVRYLKEVGIEVPAKLIPPEYKG